MTIIREFAEANERHHVAWVKACEHDGIDPAANFAVFSLDNPFAGEAGTLALELLKVKERLDNATRLSMAASCLTDGPE